MRKLIMAEETTLQRAYRQSQLWPPIYAAVDVFLRRRASGAEPYELTWRLIHVWECVVLTLAQSAISRLMAEKDERKEELRIIREKCYGVGWESSEATIKRRTGAFDGSMDKWIEVLEYVSTVSANGSDYLSSLSQFLNGKSGGDAQDTLCTVDLAPFTSAWARACDVPPGLSREKVIVKNAFRVVNGFRNRLAHVPFPYDPISDVYQSLLTCTEQLFAAEPKPTSRQGALAGCIGFRRHVIKGATPRESALFDAADDPLFIFDFAEKGECREKWNAKLFIHIDKMLRPYILTRLKDEEGWWEYTRYLAESNAVVTVQEPAYLSYFAVPSDPEYLMESEETPSCVETCPSVSEEQEPGGSKGKELAVANMGDVNWAIRIREFAPAIEYLENLLEKRQDYHVGWLRLGHAKREYAVDLYTDQCNDNHQSDRIRQLLESSLGDFRRAGGHISSQYKAEAHYHASKSHFRLWQYFKDESCLEKTRQEADEAARLYPDSKYDSWIEFLWNVQ
jgi:hypothetical protein